MGREHQFEMPAIGEPRGSMWQNVQVLRGIAALMVVVHHLIDGWNNYFARDLPSVVFDGFATGVDIFFVISGFVIATSTSGAQAGWRDFLWRRIARVVPLYWLLTLAAALLINAGFKLFGGAPASGWDVARSLFFLPVEAPKPILFVGWSLNYEMFFYAVFAATLWCSEMRARLFVLVAIFLALTFVAAVSGSQSLAYWTRPIIWEFVAGVAIAVFADRIAAYGRASALPVGWLFVALGFAIVLTAGPADAGGAPDVLLRLLGSILIVLGGVISEAQGRILRSPLLLAAGDASYSLYLVHPFVLQFGGKVALVTGAATTVGSALLVAMALFVVAWSAGWLLYRTVERPIQMAVKRARVRPISPQTIAPVTVRQ